MRWHASSIRHWVRAWCSPRRWIMLVYFVLSVVFVLSIAAGVREYHRIVRVSRRAVHDSGADPQSSPRRPFGIRPPTVLDPEPIPAPRPSPDWRRVGRIVVPRAPSPGPSMLPEHDPSACADPIACHESFPWDDRACWGCPKACRRSAFLPYGHENMGKVEREAGAARARARADDPYSSDAPAGHHRQVGRPLSCDVDSLWDETCRLCCEYIRDEWKAGRDPLQPVDLSTVEVEAECPF